ncbi:MAG: DNA recombination protein RmuC [Rhodospirillales bacterium]|nr:MAG: DNA recombination protein RmuC [Rhodospirillales bacterium]
MSVLQQVDPVVLIAFGAGLLAVLGVLLLAVLVLRGQSSSTGALAARISQIAEQHVMAQDRMAERLQAQERALTEMVDRRLGDVSRRLGDSLQQQTTRTATTMNDLRERLGAIKAAQENITRLSQQVVSLQDVLSNKQARGAFGEVQLEDQVKSALPPSAYRFQAKLENGRIADCLLDLPSPPGAIAVDAKFPLESYYALRAAKDDGTRAAARKTFGTDVLKHVNDIARRYIVPGETADSALMFLPSEAVYAELHAELPEIIQKSHKARVYIVSPTTLMATLNTIRAVLKDAQMREQAGLILAEVGKMAKDVDRLSQRVDNLDKHFGLAEKDIREIRVSAGKVARRAERIEEMELDKVEASEDSIEQAAAPKLALAFDKGERE